MKVLNRQSDRERPLPPIRLPIIPASPQHTPHAGRFFILFSEIPSPIQDPLTGLGAGFGSASADIFLTESLRSPFHSGQRPRGAYIRWGD